MSAFDKLALMEDLKAQGWTEAPEHGPYALRPSAAFLAKFSRMPLYVYDAKGLQSILDYMEEDGFHLDQPRPPLYDTLNEISVDMVLFCPACGGQHIDAPMTDAEYAAHLHESSWWELGGDKPERWTNPPHRSHLCHFCKHVWRPADVPTNGVKSVQTKGKDDSPGPPN